MACAKTSVRSTPPTVSTTAGRTSPLTVRKREALDRADQPHQESVDTEVAQAVVARVEPHVVVGVVEPARNRHAVHHRRLGFVGVRPSEGRPARAGGSEEELAVAVAVVRAAQVRRLAPRHVGRRGDAAQNWTSDSRRNGQREVSGCASWLSRRAGQDPWSAELQSSPPLAVERARLLRKGATWQDFTCSSRRNGQRTAVVLSLARQRAFLGAGSCSSRRSPPSAIVTPSLGVTKAWSSLVRERAPLEALHAARAPRRPRPRSRKRGSRARVRCS